MFKSFTLSALAALPMASKMKSPMKSLSLFPRTTSVRFLALSLGLTVAGFTQQASATDSTWAGAFGGTQNWQTATNWSTNPTIPSSAGDTATFSSSLNANTTVQLNGTVTLGSLTSQSTTNELNIQNGTGGSITFNTGSATVPTINLSRSSGVGLLLYATVNGSNGLTIIGTTTTEIRVNGSTNWAGFSGGLTIARGYVTLQADANGTNTTLPTDERLTLGTVGTTNFNLNNRPATVASLVGTSSSYIYNSTASSSRILTVGDASTDAVFAGTIGQKSDGTSVNDMKLAKQGAGTQTISGSIVGLTTVDVNTNGGTLILNGSNSYSGTTTVNSGGRLLVNGTHAPSANSGRYLVLAGSTLGGTGTIKPYDTTGSLTGLSIAGVTSPGNPSVNGGIGTLTIDGSNSTRAVVAFEGAGTWAMQLGAFGTGDKIALVNGQTNDVFFNNNVINFTDTTSGNLAGGQYVLFSADVANTYSGLTKDGSGFITAGLTIGSGLSAYSGSTLQVVGNNIVLNLNAPAPGAPSGLTVTATIGGTALSWTAGTNAGSYIVKRATTSGGPYTTIASGLTTTSYVDGNYTPGTTYYYVVVATSGTGTSGNSNQVSAVPHVGERHVDRRHGNIFRYDEVERRHDCIGAGCDDDDLDRRHDHRQHCRVARHHHRHVGQRHQSHVARQRQRRD